ncbi:hypothetical protein BC830DRAFT_1165251 [Chytriomyces sp. MP71]|nr:hypothetical protein BC830DRAFT_1165251 [Chytriomyces sp. MP71]
MSSEESEILSQLRRGINDLEGNVDGFANGSPSHHHANHEVVDLEDAASVAASNGKDFEDLFPALPSSSAPKVTQAWRPAMAKSAAPAANGAAGARKTGTGKRVTETFEIPISMQVVVGSQKLPLNGKGSVADLAKILGLRTQTTIEVLANRTTFVITGKPDSVKSCRREIVQHVGATVTEVVLVPSSVRPHILGAGGKNLKDLTLRTGTNINVPKAIKPAKTGDNDDETVDDDDEQPITIKGNFEGVSEAKREIEELVLKRTQNLHSRILIDRSFHPFIAGANNATVESIEASTGARIHIPPMVPADKKEGVPEKNPNEISLVGSRDAIKAAELQIRALHENLQQNTRTLSFPVKKRQHRFIIGSKAKNLQEILEQTGCSVELPLASDPSDMVTVRGPDNMLSVALQAVLQKANQVSLEEIHVTQLIPKATNPVHFNRYVFTKERDEITKIETNHSVSIIRLTGSEANPEDPVIEIQGKTKNEAEAARIQLTQLIREWGAVLFFGDVEIPHGLHKFVVGKGGQNISKMRSQPVWEGRLVDVIVPNESDASDEVLLVVKRLSAGLAGAPGAKAAKKNAATPANDDAEVLAFVEKVRAEILSVSLANADFVSEVLPVAGKFHGRLIGSGGKDLKELLAPYGDEVSVRFPPAKDDKKKDEGSKKAPTIEADTVVIKGPKKLVADVKAKVVKIVAELKRIETLASHSEILKVKKGTGKKLVHGAGAPVSSGSNIVNEHGLRGDSIGWLIRLVKEALAATPPAAKTGEDVVTAEDNHLISLLKVDVTESTNATGDDSMAFTGPKSVVAIAKKIVSERAVRLANQVTVELKVFQACSNEAKAVLQEKDAQELKSRTLRRLIGKEGKNVKALMDKFAVSIQFPEGRKKRRGGKEDTADEEAEAEDIDEEDAGTVVDGLVIIKGNPKDVEACKKEILKSVENDIIRSFNISFVIPREVLPQILGAQGSKIRALRDTHDVRIDLRDVENDEGEASIEISLEGSKANCLAVQKKILGVTDEIVNVETRGISVPSYLHKDIIGPGGSRIKTVIDSFGGPDKVKVQIPPRGDSAIGSPEANTVSVKAHVSQIDDLSAAVINIVNDVLAGDNGEEDPLSLFDEEIHDTMTQTVTIPRGDVSRVLGKGGDAIKDVMRKFKVIFWFCESSSDSETVDVKVVGLADNMDGVDKAAEDVKGKIRTSKKVSLPDKVKANLAAAGAAHDSEVASIQDLIKKVRADSSGAASAEISSASLSGSSDAFILIRGDTKYVDIAVKTIEKGLEELTKYDSTVRIPIDGAVRPHIIGKAGATISKIRAETGAVVELSKPSNSRNAAADVVVIRGTAEAVEAATEAIQKIVTDQATRIAQDVARDAARAAAAAAKETASFTASGPARIDDDIVDAEGSTYIPGFAPGQKIAKGKKAGVPVTVAQPAAAQPGPSYYASFVSSSTAESWQDVKKKGKKGDEDLSSSTLSAEAVPVPGSGPSKKKKKNKKSGAAAAASTNGNDEEDAVEVEAISEPTPAPIAVPTSAPVKVAAKAAAAPAAKASPIAVDTFKAAVSSAPTPNPSPAVPVSAKQLPVPAPAKSQLSAAPVTAPAPAAAAEDDGWTVINKKGAAAEPIAEVGGETTAAKKKKNKKKKKKASAMAGAAEAGDDDDEGDE